jgi:hypothetical protein
MLKSSERKGQLLLFGAVFSFMKCGYMFIRSEKTKCMMQSYELIVFPCLVFLSFLYIRNSF